MPNSIGKGLLANAPSIEMFLQYELVGLQPGSANLTTDISYRDHAFPLLFLDSREGASRLATATESVVRRADIYA